MREVKVLMKWSETITVEVPDDWPQVDSVDELPDDCQEQIRPFDPATDFSSVDDLHYVSVEEVDNE